MPERNSPGSAAPFAICVRLFSHSAVSCGEVSISGKIDIRAAPFCVGISCLPLRSAKPPFTSFSMTAARVAGVPSPRRSASGSVSPFPARSIAERSDASLWGFGGVVVCSVTFAAGLGKPCPSESSGSVTPSFSPSSGSGLLFSVAQYLRSISFQPSESTVFPFAVKSVPAQEKTAVTASKICGSAVAESRRAPARVRIFFSLSGSAARSVFASSIVGMIAWWSDTFLLSNTFAISGVKPAPAIKGSFSQSSVIMPAAVSPMSSVRKLLSVLG